MSESVPTEAARAGGPRPAPDFSALALEHLEQRCDAFRQHVREHLERTGSGGTAPIEGLSDDLKRFRNTLVLLERPGAVFVAEELLALLAARADGGLDEEAFARVLVDAGERLGDHVARLRRGADGDGALVLLPLVNDSRACRGEPLLSEALLLAAGIAVPTAPDPTAALDADGARARERFLARAAALHPTLERELAAGSGRAAEHDADPRRAVAALDDLVALCRAPGLAQLEASLDAAAALLEGVAAGVVDAGGAPRRLLDTLVERLGRAPAAAALEPDDALCRDLLYYVALLEPSSPRVAALHRRFGLSRVRPALESARDETPSAPLVAPLAGAIRDSLDHETSGLRQWLDQAPTAADHPHVLRLRERLAHVEPVLTLLGAREARVCLRRIVDTLDTLPNDAPVGAAERLMLAESLIRLDRALDDGGAAPPHEPVDGAAATDGAARRAYEEAVASCLEEARRRLLKVGESLNAPRAVGADGGDAELRTIERALSILGLADVGPLLRGLRTANARIDAASPPALRDTLATLLASLEFYLGCVLRPDDEGARRLRRNAEEALARLEARLTPPASDADRGTSAAASVVTLDPSPERRRDGTPHVRADALSTAVFDADADDTIAQEPAERGALSEALARMDAIGETLARGGDEDEGPDVVVLRDAFDALAEIGARGGHEELRALGGGASRLVARAAADDAPLSPRSIALLEEAHAVLPQLIERVRGSSEPVRGLDALLRDLDEAGTTDGADGGPEIESDGDGADRGSEIDVGGDGRTIRDGTVEGDTLDDSGALTLDNTLQEVFRRECAMHIDTLARAVEAARGATSDARLPSDPMLRSLHTLSGSAQTVDARPIVSVVQPLQRVALVRQRIDRPFDEEETAFVGELVGVLRERLESLESGEPVGEEILAIEARLPAFVDAALAARGADPRSETSAEVGLDAGGASAAPSSGSSVDEEEGADRDERAPPRGSDALDGRRSLDSVFDEEARELLGRMRRAVASENDVESATDRALGHLHTLKGSARMAGRGALAERAHALEGLVQGMPGAEARRRALADGRRELQALLLHGGGEVPPPAAAGREPAPGEDGAETGSPHEATRAADERAPAGHERSEAAVPSGAPTTLADAALDAASVPAATFESLLTLATDVTVSQARLGGDLARLREVCRDLESAAGRWRRLPHEAPLLETPAAREMLADLDAARRGLGDALRLADVEQQHASRAASSLQQTLIRTRLVRVEELAERLAGAVRDAAESTGREVRFVVEGGEITLDGALRRQLGAPLEHLVRNAVVHGIEPPETRRANGKDPSGTVRLSAAIDGTELVLAVEDDGAGVDREAVSRRREAAGGAPVETTDALQEALCETGFTTLEAASAVGGRGLGLSAVAETLARLDGRLQIGTRAGLGTSVTCRLRQRIIVNQAVLVRAARRLYALPVNVVRRVGGEGGSNVADGVERPRHALLSLLGGAPGKARAAEEGEIDDTGAHVEGSAELVVEVGGRELVLEVDRVLGYRELLTQPLGPQLAALRRYGGGSVLPDGRQVLVIELDRLLDGGRPAPGVAAQRPRRDPESMRPVALIVDDSITLRVAAAAMLERHGVESREARDGVEALDALARALPELMIVDLDMPRLGGFDLIRRMRERHGERAPPVVVISSRDGEDDRRRAEALGAVRYLTKPYTEQELHEALLACGLRLPDLTIA